MNRVLLNPRFWWLPVLAWGALALASLVWNFHALDDHTRETAVNRGRSIFKVIESVRLWNARHGGVYALVDPSTPPNEYLDVPERDVPAPSGRWLTMVNPAYMTRQLVEPLRQLSQIELHLTSLKPLNPTNQADAWESAALLAFGDGAKERFELSGRGSDAQGRYMAPLRVEAPCLRCHANQGYVVGDIRGGLSVTFPAADLLAAERIQKGNLLAVHGVAWLLLSTLTLFALWRLRDNVLSLREAKAQQDALVEQRTAQLREEVREREATEARLRLLLESSGDGIYEVDQEGRITFINSAALRLLGYCCPDELLGREAGSLCYCDSADPHANRCCVHDQLARILREGTRLHREDELFIRADGTTFSVDYRLEPLIIDGRTIGAVVSFDDITERKRKEHELRKLSNAIEYSPESVMITDAAGDIEYVNRKFVETTGYTLAEAVGRKPSILKSGQTRAEVYQELWSTITAGGVWQGALLNRKRDGELFWEEASISPITDAKGNITHFVSVKEDITERRRLEEKIWRQANFDPLTELPNRRLFYDRLQQSLARAQREERPMALMFIDLDRFKEVNDTFGHTAGDELLREASRRLVRAVRRSDTVARMGGDEFTVILPAFEDGGETVNLVAERVRKALMEPFMIEPRPITISASIGVVFYPDDGDSIEILLKNADIAMYRAKEAGRNAVQYFRTA